MCCICDDNRFEIIENTKNDLMEKYKELLE